MSKHHPYPNESDMDVRVMVGDPVAIAWLWILAYLDNINGMIADDRENEWGGQHSDIDIDELIDTALSDDYIIRGGVFEGFGIDPTFWEKLAVLKEDPSIATNNKGSFFSCSC